MRNAQELRKAENSGIIWAQGYSDENCDTIVVGCFGRDPSGIGGRCTQCARARVCRPDGDERASDRRAAPGQDGKFHLTKEGKEIVERLKGFVSSRKLM